MREYKLYYQPCTAGYSSYIEHRAFFAAVVAGKIVGFGPASIVFADIYSGRSVWPLPIVFPSLAGG